MYQPQRLESTWKLPGQIEASLALKINYGWPSDARLLAALANELEATSRKFFDELDEKEEKL